MTLVNLTGAWQFGVELDETGINIESFEVETAPEYKEFALNKTGEKRGFAVAVAEQNITVSGEQSLTTGVMAATFATAVTLANDVDYFGQTTGAVYMDSATITQDRSAFKKYSGRFSRNQGIPGA